LAGKFQEVDLAEITLDDVGRAVDAVEFGMVQLADGLDRSVGRRDVVDLVDPLVSVAESVQHGGRAVGQAEEIAPGKVAGHFHCRQRRIDPHQLAGERGHV